VKAAGPIARPTKAAAAKSKDEQLLDFCQQQAACIKSSPKTFCEWLRSQDICSLQDLAEAMDDEEFRSEMQANGLKGFKKTVFKKAISTATASAAGEPTNCKHAAAIPLAQNGLDRQQQQQRSSPLSLLETEGPHELYCPISFVLMVDDPVVASDHYTYERSAIESWFARHEGSGEPIRSPITQQILTSLDLIPNIMLRNMAREYALSSGSTVR
jgi:hypothetical protein